MCTRNEKLVLENYHYGHVFSHKVNYMSIGLFWFVKHYAPLNAMACNPVNLKDCVCGA
jgi:hypothetical protein